MTSRSAIIGRAPGAPRRVPPNPRGAQPRGSSGRGSSQLPCGSAMAGECSAVKAGGRRIPAARAAIQATRNPASNASPAPGRIGHGDCRRRDLEPVTLPGRPSQHRGALRAPLHDGDTARYSSSRSFGWLPSNASASAAVAKMRSGVSLADQRAGGPPAVREQRPDRSQVDADGGTGGAAELDRLAAGLTERLTEQRVDRQVHDVGTGEPVRSQVVGTQVVGRASIRRRTSVARPGRRRHRSGPFASRRRGRPAPSRRRTGPPRQRPARGIAADRRDQARLRSEPAEPAGGVRRRSALDER